MRIALSAREAGAVRAALAFAIEYEKTYIDSLRGSTGSGKWKRESEARIRRWEALDVRFKSLQGEVARGQQ
jgi:hypothetical protein